MSKKNIVAIEDIEVNDEMVVKAATDINEVLTPEPLLDLKMPGEGLQKDVKELFDSIREGDLLSEETWVTLKALGWKENKTSDVVEQPPTVSAPKVSAPKKNSVKIQKAKTVVKKEKDNPFRSFTGILQAIYKGKKLTAKVQNGVVTFKGKKYNSPSTAGIAARCSVKEFSGRITCNGWSFWSYEQSPGQWVKLTNLRK